MPAALHNSVETVKGLHRGVILSTLRAQVIKELSTFKLCMKSHLLGVAIKEEEKKLVILIFPMEDFLVSVWVS